MGSYYVIIKRELIQDIKCKLPEQAKKEIFKYIEIYYNTQKMNAFFTGISLSIPI